MVLINYSELKEFLERWISYPNSKLNKNVIPFIHGKAGIGKTEIVEKLAKKYNKKLVILNLSHQEEGDLIGIPVKEKVNDKYITSWAEPEWLGKNKENRDVILFLDEIDRTPKNILNVILTLLREYRIHTHYLPKEWKIIAAGNSGFNDDFYDVQELDNALSTRFVHLFYELEPYEWIKWAKDNNINEIIIKYIEQNPTHLIKENTTDFKFAYPNPRTWELLSETLKFLEPNNLSIIKKSILGTIGEEIGNLFFAFYKKNIKNKVKIYTFYELKKDEVFKEFIKEDKNTITENIINILNNIDIYLKNKENLTLIAKIIAFLGYKKYYELAFGFLSQIETLNQNYYEILIKILKQKYKETFKKLKEKRIDNI